MGEIKAQELNLKNTFPEAMSEHAWSTWTSAYKLEEFKEQKVIRTLSPSSQTQQSWTQRMDMKWKTEQWKGPEKVGVLPLSHQHPHKSIRTLRTCNKSSHQPPGTYHSPTFNNFRGEIKETRMKKASYPQCMSVLGSQPAPSLPSHLSFLFYFTRRQ